MKCPICGKQTLPGAKLCGPCRSALKRARDDSVWEMPGQSSTPGEAEPVAAAAPSRWVLGSSRLAGWRGVTLGALAVVLAVGACTLIARSGEAAKAPDERPRAAATLPAAPAVAQPVPTAEKPAVEPPADLLPHEEIVQPPRHQPPRPKLPRAEPEPVASPVPAVEPAPRVEPPRPLPAPPREASRPADPWQRMGEALRRCAAEDLFGRIRCEYGVRTSYCDGHWGEVPQCPGAPVNDHGQ